MIKKNEQGAIFLVVMLDLVETRDMVKTYLSYEIQVDIMVYCFKNSSVLS